MADMILTRELFRHMCEEQEKLDKHIYESRDVKEPSLKGLDIGYTSEANEAVKELKKDWKWWTTKERDRERFIEELADCFHFVASMANKTRTVGYCYLAIELEYKKVSRLAREHYPDEDLIYKAVKGTVQESIASLIAIAEVLGATTDEIKTAFEDSLEKNYARMASGY